MTVRSGLCAALILLALTAPPVAAQDVETARKMLLDGRASEALAALLPLAEAGDAPAQVLLGTLYDQGLGTGADPAQAEAWWQRAAAQGEGAALYHLGGLYDQGRPGLPPDDARAADYYRQAVADGVAEAYAGLGAMTEAGRVEGSAPEEALDLYLAGRAAGASGAILRLGDLYAAGTLVEADMGAALGYYREAAALGDPQALHALALAYDRGMGTRRDIFATRALYAEAKQRGSARSAASLAMLVTFEDSYFTDPAYGHALCLYALARASEAEAAEFRPDCATIEAGLSEEETERGERMYRSW